MVPAASAAAAAATSVVVFVLLLLAPTCSSAVVGAPAAFLPPPSLRRTRPSSLCSRPSSATFGRRAPAVQGQAVFGNRVGSGRIFDGAVRASSSSVSEAEATSTSASASSGQQQPPLLGLAKRALLISSFSDGVLSSPSALDFFKWGLASSLAESVVSEREEAVRESVLFSPCAGPDVEALDKLDEADEAMNAASSLSGEGSEGGGKDYGKIADAMLDRLLSPSSEDGNKDDDESPLRCRVLYVPTAMYALNPSSSNTPGKQRQRARADGKKRRNLVVKAVESLLNDDTKSQRRKVDVLAATLDLSDGSVKQPVIGSSAANNDQSALFPSDGRDALNSWGPHLVYVEGGNTFWLAHCLEEGGWEEDLRRAVCGGGDEDGRSVAAMYVGKSAGAIIAGERVETATWKGWDDPSVVESRPTYEDWSGIRGLALAGPDASFFPHMSDEWTGVVEEKIGSLSSSSSSQSGEEEEEGEAQKVFCLMEWDVCCVDGTAGKVFSVEGEEPLE